MVPRNSFRQFHLNESHQTKVERCWCRCLCPHATPHGAHSGSGGTLGAQNILRRPWSIRAQKRRRRIPSGTNRPSIASPLVIKQRLSRGRSLSHRPLTNNPLGSRRRAQRPQRGVTPAGQGCTQSVPVIGNFGCTYGACFRKRNSREKGGG